MLKEKCRAAVIDSAGTGNSYTNTVMTPEQGKNW